MVQPCRVPLTLLFLGFLICVFPVLFLNFFSFVFILHFFRMQKLAMNRARRRQMFLNLTKEIFS